MMWLDLSIYRMVRFYRILHIVLIIVISYVFLELNCVYRMVQMTFLLLECSKFMISSLSECPVAKWGVYYLLISLFFFFLDKKIEVY